mgnify:CR=1 FL=1
MKKSFFSGSFLIVNCFLFLLLSLTATGVEHPPADHAGGDLILSHDDVIWGVHTNIGAFSIPGTTEASTDTVRVAAYDGITTSGRGMVEIHAKVIDIEGILDATGSGYTGGAGGGGGGPGYIVIGSYPGAPGGVAVYGAGLFDGEDGDYGMGYMPQPGNGGDGGQADGPYGGAGAEGAVYGGYWDAEPEDGGYLAPESNGDNTTDDSTCMGSGGGGAGGYFGAVDGETKGAGGDAGGSGGGVIRLIPEEQITLHSTCKILADGSLGGPGEPSGADGGQGGDVFPFADETTGHNGGAGAGGGILLDVRLTSASEVLIESGATISSAGGREALGGAMIKNRSLSSENGGTIKILYTGEAPDLTGVNILSGKTITLPPAKVEDWRLY